MHFLLNFTLHKWTEMNKNTTKERQIDWASRRRGGVLPSPIRGAPSGGRAPTGAPYIFIYYFALIYRLWSGKSRRKSPCKLEILFPRARAAAQEMGLRGPGIEKGRACLSIMSPRGWVLVSWIGLWKNLWRLKGWFFMMDIFV